MYKMLGDSDTVKSLHCGWNAETPGLIKFVWTLRQVAFLSFIPCHQNSFEIRESCQPDTEKAQDMPLVEAASLLEAAPTFATGISLVNNIFPIKPVKVGFHGATLKKFVDTLVNL